MIRLRYFSTKNLTLATIFLGITIVILSILILQKDLSERPGVEDAAAIRSTIKGFTKAKSLRDRMNFATDSPEMQRNLRSYLLIPYEQRQILNQEIDIDKVWLDEKSHKNKAEAQQELEYLNLDSDKLHSLRINYQLEKQTKWLIADFQAKAKRGN